MQGPDAAAAKCILVVEDEPAARKGLQQALAAEGYRVLAADLAALAWQLFRSEKPDLVVLDLNLPDGSGLDVCQKIRDHEDRKETPVIILTGRHELDSKVQGFKAGADQYLVKPVAPQELTLWVSALLRRLALDKGEGDKLRAGELEIDLKARLVRYKGELVEYLTGKEFDLLYFLVKKRPQVLTRKYILTHLWHTIVVDSVVDVHLAHLRKKLPQELRDKLQSVIGKGYRFFE